MLGGIDLPPVQLVILVVVGAVVGVPVLALIAGTALAEQTGFAAAVMQAGLVDRKLSFGDLFAAVLAFLSRRCLDRDLLRTSLLPAVP